MGQGPDVALGDDQWPPLCFLWGWSVSPETTPWREGGPLEPAAVFRGSGGEKDPGAGSSPFINSPSWCGVSPHTLQRLGSPVSPERVRIDSYLAPGGQKGDRGRAAGTAPDTNSHFSPFRRASSPPRPRQLPGPRMHPSGVP